MNNEVFLLVSFFSNTLVLVAVSIMLAIITITLSRTAVLHGPPYFIKKVLVGWTGTILGVGHLIPLVCRIF